MNCRPHRTIRLVQLLGGERGQDPHDDLFMISTRRTYVGKHHLARTYSAWITLFVLAEICEKCKHRSIQKESGARNRYLLDRHAKIKPTHAQMDVKPIEKHAICLAFATYSCKFGCSWWTKFAAIDVTLLAVAEAGVNPWAGAVSILFCTEIHISTLFDTSPASQATLCKDLIGRDVEGRASMMYLGGNRGLNMQRQEIIGLNIFSLQGGARALAASEEKINSFSKQRIQRDT